MGVYYINVVNLVLESSLSKKRLLRGGSEESRNSWGVIARNPSAGSG